MIFKRTNGTEIETIEFIPKATKLRYKLNKKGSRFVESSIVTTDDVPYIIKSKKKINLNHFLNDDGELLSTYIKGDKKSKEMKPYSFMNYASFCFILTKEPESLVHDVVMTAKEKYAEYIISQKAKTKKKKEPISTFISQYFVEVSPETIVLETIKAKRLK